jgi:hypothetical protein
MEFYASGRRAGTFDDGIEKALRRLLADPEFVYRPEVAPANVPAGGTVSVTGAFNKANGTLRDETKPTSVPTARKSTSAPILR